MTNISKSEFDLLRNYILENCGISIGDEKVYLIESRLTKLVAETGCTSFGDFYLKVTKGPLTAYREKIIDAITTNETLWFRDSKPWDLMKTALIPEFIRKIQSNEKQKIRIWSAASSTGQEPYSLAILISEACAQAKIPAERFEIIATDISPSALFIAISGKYNAIAMNRGMDATYKQKYFTQTGPIWSISNDIKKMVSFKQFNLQNDFLPLGKFDLVLCRNVAIYFSVKFKTELFSKIARVSNPHSYLLLGSAETLSSLSDRYERKISCGCIYYQLKSEV